MKKINITSILLLTVFVSVFTTAICQTQTCKWYMNDYAIDFSGENPEIQELPYINPSKPLDDISGRLANNATGFHDKNGNLLFYSVWETNNNSNFFIHNAIGERIGRLNLQSGNGELLTIPFSTIGDNNKYLIIYPSVRGAGATRYLEYVVIDLLGNEGKGTISESYIIDFTGTGVPTPVCAVSTERDNQRYLFTNNGKGIMKFVLDFSEGQTTKPEEIINPDSTKLIYSFNRPFSAQLSELELSPNGKKLVLANTGNERGNVGIHVIDLDKFGDFIDIQQYPIGTPIAYRQIISGVEFSKDNSKLFVNLDLNNTCFGTVKEGIYVVDLSTKTVSAEPISGTEQYSRSHLEMAYDGYLYAVGYDSLVNENRLLRIDPFQEQALDFLSLPGLLPYIFESRDYKCYGGFTLPDQIDGEIYCNNSQEKCENNLVRNGDFSEGIVGASNNIPYSKPDYWERGNRTTPQYSPSMGNNTLGYISMWGNKVVGESIYQRFSFQKGKRYAFQFAFKSSGNLSIDKLPYVRFKLRASKTLLNSPIVAEEAVIGISQDVNTGDGWVNATMVWTADDDYNFLYINPENEEIIDGAQFTSFGQFDDLFISEIEQSIQIEMIAGPSLICPEDNSFEWNILNSEFSKNCQFVLAALDSTLPNPNEIISYTAPTANNPILTINNLNGYQHPFKLVYRCVENCNEEFFDEKIISIAADLVPELASFKVIYENGQIGIEAVSEEPEVEDVVILWQLYEGAINYTNPDSIYIQIKDEFSVGGILVDSEFDETNLSELDYQYIGLESKPYVLKFGVYHHPEGQGGCGWREIRIGFIIHSNGSLKIINTEKAESTIFSNSFDIIRESRETNNSWEDLGERINNYPNPFTGVTTIEFELTQSDNVTLSVFDMKGQLIQQLITNEIRDKGIHTVAFQTQDAESGVYFYHLQTSKEVLSGQMILTK